eukprot:9479687-Pyramimonas_sp.AAC.1
MAQMTASHRAAGSRLPTASAEPRGSPRQWRPVRKKAASHGAAMSHPPSPPLTSREPTIVAPAAPRRHPPR